MFEHVAMLDDLDELDTLVSSISEEIVTAHTVECDTDLEQALAEALSFARKLVTELEARTRAFRHEGP